MLFLEILRVWIISDVRLLHWGPVEKRPSENGETMGPLNIFNFFK